MSLEFEILNVLIDSYERSKVSKGQNKVHKDIKLDITHSVFEKHRNNDNGELDLAIQLIEKNGYAKAIYTRNGQFQCFALNLDESSIDRLYKHIKRINPKNVIERYKELFFEKQNGCQIVHDFSSRMIELLDEKKLSSVHQYVSSEEDINDICKAIESMSLLEEDVQERIFCAKLFADSKRFNDLRGKITRVIRDFSEEPFDDEDDVIAMMGVLKNTAYAFIKGNIVIRLNNQTIDLGKYGEPLALSDSAIEKIEIVEIPCNKLFTIENLTSFDVFDAKDSVAVYLAGYHNRTKRKLIEKIHEIAPQLDYYHYGDIDAGGFYILNHLREKTNIVFKPYKMGINELIKFKSSCKPLTKNDIKRLEKMSSLKSFSEFANMIEYMLENNIKLEQEALE